MGQSGAETSSSTKSSTSKGIVILLPLLAIVSLLTFIMFCGDGNFLEEKAQILQQFSYFLATIDGLIVRLVGIVLLLIGSSNFIWQQYFYDNENLKREEENTSLSFGKDKLKNGTFYDNKLTRIESKKTRSKLKKHGSNSRNYIFNLVKLALIMAIGGGAIVGSYSLDEMDNQIEEALGISPLKPTILASWVQVVPDKNSNCVHNPSENDTKFSDNCPVRLSVRTVTSVQTRGCPKVSFDRENDSNNKVEMKQRIPTEPNAFLSFRGINVCEGYVEEWPLPTSIRVQGGDTIKIDKNIGKDGPKHIVVIGDTGCRGNSDQKCTDDQWPMKEVIDASAEEDPDLVLHLGDFIYTNTDNWEGWNEVFFKPAKKLLGKAPWVMVRGNHEACGKINSHGPHGYSLFFGINEFTECKNNGWLEDTYAVDLSNNLRLVIADSSKAYVEEKNSIDLIGNKCAENAAKGDDKQTCKMTKAIFKQVSNAATVWQGENKEKKVWLATHVPVFGLEDKSDTKSQIPESSAMMLAAWQAAPINQLEYIISGDRHLFQVVKPMNKGDGSQSNTPIQVSVGASGVNLDSIPPEPIHQECSDNVSVKELNGKEYPFGESEMNICSSNNKFGFVLITRDCDMKFKIVKKIE